MLTGLTGSASEVLTGEVCVLPGDATIVSRVSGIECDLTHCENWSFNFL